MNLVKEIMACLMGVSLCLANISGIVTDTGTTPIAGAVVQLEKGGQTAITEADGSFTIITGSAVLPNNDKLLQNRMSVGIFGNNINLTIPKRTCVEVTSFNLNGKALSMMRKTLDAGKHSLSLSYRGNGVYLYKVKVGANDFVLKYNTLIGVSSENRLTAQMSSSNALAKLAKSMAATNNVIVATKTGYLNYRCDQYNLDTTGIMIKMIANAGNLTDTDGNIYQSVKIGNQVWMAENLRVTKYNDGSDIPNSTSIDINKPKYYILNRSAFGNGDSIIKPEVLYNWYVVDPANPKKIAPLGWHVPSHAEWDTLQNNLIAKGFNWDKTNTGNKIAKSLAAMIGWNSCSDTGTIGCDLTKNNSSGFSAFPSGYIADDGWYQNQSKCGYWWSTTLDLVSFGTGSCLSSDQEKLTENGLDKTYSFSVRLLKD